MWLLYQDTWEERYAEIARLSEKKLERCFQDFYGLHHDVGFMYMPTAVADWRLTGNQDSRRTGLHGAVKILRAIAETWADFGRECDAIVQGCSSAYHAPEHHITMSYADYFFIEAIYKVKGIGRFMW